MKILITGAGGFLGQGLVHPFAGKHQLRLMDIRPFESPHEVIVGDVSDLSAVESAAEGMDAIVIAHMAPRTELSYATPAAAFDINVQGAANLFHAAHSHGIDRVCLISSLAAVGGRAEPGAYLSRETIPTSECNTGYYGISKTCQEMVAQFAHRQNQTRVAVLRVGWVADADSNTVKFGNPVAADDDTLIDRRDIGEVARRALELPDLHFEILYVMGQPEADAFCDAAYTRQRLDWTPAHPFTP